MFIVQVLVGPSKQLKEIIQTEHNIVKNPNWPKANQLAIYKRVAGATEKQIVIVVRAGLEPEPSDCESDTLPDHSATLPPLRVYSLHIQFRKRMEELNRSNMAVWRLFCNTLRNNLFEQEVILKSI